MPLLWLAACLQGAAAVSPLQGPWPPLALQGPSLGGSEEREPLEPLPRLRGPALLPQQQPDPLETSPTWRAPALSSRQKPEPEPIEASPVLHDTILGGIVPPVDEEPRPLEPSPMVRDLALSPQQELEPLETSPTLRDPALSSQQEPEPTRPSPVLHDPILGDIEPEADENLPDYGEKHVLDLTKYPNARCLDGSPGAYYYSPGIHGHTQAGRKKFFIFRMGGAWCKDKKDCVLRSRSMLGSSAVAHGWKHAMNLGGKFGFPNSGFNRDREANPLLWNWNHVYMIYCDGAYFAGRNSTPQYVGLDRIYFNGADIQDAVLQDLDEKYGLRGASDVILGGCSAGGIATYVTSGSVFKHPAVAGIPNKAAFAFSGFFMDKPEGMNLDWYFSEKKFPWYVQNMSGSVSTRCQQAEAPEPHRCFIPEVAQAYLKVPTFTWESMYDDYQLQHNYGRDCVRDPVCAAIHKAKITKALNTMFEMHPDFGGFVSGCRHHCEDSSQGKVRNIRPIDSTLPLQALALWYRAYVGQERAAVANWEDARRMWTDDAGYPCPECCPSEGHPSRHFLHDLE